LDYYQRALASHEELGDKAGVAITTENIGNMYADEKYEGYHPAKAVRAMQKK